jgi:phage-related protein
LITFPEFSVANHQIKTSKISQFSIYRLKSAIEFPILILFPCDYIKKGITLIMAWTIELLNKTVEDELRALPRDMLARFGWISRLIESHGLEKVHEPHIKHLEGDLWEMRLKGKDGISRAIYVTATPKRVVLVRVFIKKTQKTPRREIALALKRSKEV